MKALRVEVFMRNRYAWLDERGGAHAHDGMGNGRRFDGIQRVRGVGILPEKEL